MSSTHNRKAGDNKPDLALTLTTATGALVLTGASVRLLIHRAGWGTATVAASVTSASGGGVGYSFATATDAPTLPKGRYEVEALVTFAGTTTQTFPEDTERPVIHVHDRLPTTTATA